MFTNLQYVVYLQLKRLLSHARPTGKFSTGARV